VSTPDDAETTPVAVPLAAADTADPEYEYVPLAETPETPETPEPVAEATKVLPKLVSTDPLDAATPLAPLAEMAEVTTPLLMPLILDALPET
jgi:hypothetical protein